MTGAWKGEMSVRLAESRWEKCLFNHCKFTRHFASVMGHDLEVRYSGRTTRATRVWKQRPLTRASLCIFKREEALVVAKCCIEYLFHFVLVRHVRLFVSTVRSTWHRFTFATILSVYNKWMFSTTRYAFPAPLFVTTIHLSVQFALAAFLRFTWPSHFRPPKSPTRKEYRWVDLSERTHQKTPRLVGSNFWFHVVHVC